MRRLIDQLWYLRNLGEVQTVPPADVLFLHRKLAGIYLLPGINARIDVRARASLAVLEAETDRPVR